MTTGVGFSLNFGFTKILCKPEKPFKKIPLMLTLSLQCTGTDTQGSRKSKIGWELTKNGCHVRSPGLSKSHIFVVFKLIIPITVVFIHLFGAFTPIWLAFSISGSSFWPVDTSFLSYFSWLAKSGCQHLKLARNTFPPFPSFWSPGAKDRCLCLRRTLHKYRLLFKGYSCNIKW